MGFLVRRINRRLWPDGPCARDDLPGDTFSDLRTKDNRLSVWLIDGPKQLNLAILALTTGSDKDGIKKMQVVTIPEEYLRNTGVNIEESEGDTTLQSLRDLHLHRDLVGINYKSLGDIAECIHRRIQEIKPEELDIELNTVKDVLADAWNDGNLTETNCPKKLWPDVQKMLKARGLLT